MALWVRELEGLGEIARYVHRFEELVGVRIPAEYWGRGRMYGCFDGTGTLVGGYTLVLVPPFRGVVFLPDEVRNTHWFFQEASMLHTLEVNGLWLERRVCVSGLDYYLVWWNLARSLRQAGKRYILLWYNRRNLHLHRLYGRMSKEMLYSGPSRAQGAHATHADICVAYTTLFKAQLTLLRFLPRFVRIALVRNIRGAWRRAVGAA